MDQERKPLRSIVIGLVLIGAAGFYMYRSGGCGQVTEAIDNVSGEITGYNALNRGEEVKEQLREVKSERKDRFRETFDRQRATKERHPWDE